MKCYICNKRVTKSELKYGDANAIVRDLSGKIVSRAFHHDCLAAKEEGELSDAMDKADEERESQMNDALYAE